MHEHILVHSFMHTCANTHTCTLMHMRARINIAHSCTHAVYNHVQYMLTCAHMNTMHTCTCAHTCNHAHTPFTLTSRPEWGLFPTLSPFLLYQRSRGIGDRGVKAQPSSPSQPHTSMGHAGL